MICRMRQERAAGDGVPYGYLNVFEPRNPLALCSEQV